MRQEVYRVAFDEASAELSEILGKFELLRIRKDRIEKVVEALKPLVVSSESTASVLERASASQPSEEPASHTPHAPAETAQPTPAPIPYPVQPANPSSDPFARRLESAVGQTSTAKDVSEYSRLFNTGVSRGN